MGNQCIVICGSSMHFMKILLTVEELAKYLKIKPDTIYKKVKRGEIPAIKLGKIVRFSKEKIDQWISTHASQTIAEVKQTARRAKRAIQDVPTVVEKIKKAPLEQKQKALKQGLQFLWADLKGRPSKSNRTKVKKKTQKLADSPQKKRKPAKRVNTASVEAPTQSASQNVPANTLSVQP